MIGMTSLASLARLRPNVRRKRISSYDRTGGNRDWVVIEAGEMKNVAEIVGPACIKHIWCTLLTEDRYQYRKIILRMWWDDEEQPSVEVPIGDFFGLGHNMVKNFVSLPLQMSPEDGRSFNCWFPMPFQKNARIEIYNECDSKLNFYFYIDYEAYADDTKLVDEYAYFHAQWRRVNPTNGSADHNIWWEDNAQAMKEAWETPNLDGKDNYLVLEAQGRGHYVGCHVDIDNFRREANAWYGEGDDMFFIDGDKLPTIYGTGTEDYFNTAFCPTQEYSAPYHGVIVNQGTPDFRWKGKNSLYRYHIEDPIFFEKSIKFSIEHGHANTLSLDYSSTAYWYQTEPHMPFPILLPVSERLPRT